MKVERQIDQIINTHLPDFVSGQETLDSILARYPEIAGDLRPRLEAAFWLQQARISVATRPGFIFDSRKYLEKRIISEQPNSFLRRISLRYTPQRWAFNILAPAIILLLLVFIMNSAILTARLSIPGDPLYSSKLFIENLQLAFTINPVEKTNLHIQHSRDRTLEFVELVIEGNYQYLPASARRMESEISASINSLNGFSQKDPAFHVAMSGELRETLSNEIFMLNVLKSTSPPSAQTGINMALQVAQSGVLALR